MKKSKIFLFLILAGLAVMASRVWADTIRVYGAAGDGYTDITKDNEGREIRRTHYGEDGVVKDHVEIDPEKGTTQTTTYDKGKPKKKVTRDKDGHDREELTYDGEGRVTERTVTDEDFNSATEEYQYDEKGRLIMVNKKDNGGGITESIDFDYDEEGHLIQVVHFGRDEQGQPKVDAKLEYDKDGNITGREGNVGGLVEDAKRLLGREFGDPNTHVTKDPLGNTVIVRHNPDGSYDVTVLNPEGKVISRQYHGSGRCYLGDECPFHHPLQNPPVTVSQARIPEVKTLRGKV